MSLLKQHKIIREALCAHEIFRRHGFSADQIFVSIARAAELAGGPPCLGVEVHHQGKEFRLRVGPSGTMTDDEMQTVWRAAVAQFNAGPPEAIRMLHASEVYASRVEIALALQSKGLVGADFKPVS